jgi:hypothetical protein
LGEVRVTAKTFAWPVGDKLFTVMLSTAVSLMLYLPAGLVEGLFADQGTLG